MTTSNLIKAQNPSGDTVVFDPATHIFRSGGRVLTSVTTFLSEFFPKFDAKKISARYAKKRGLSQSEVLAAWDAERVEGERIGNLVHSYSEALLTYKEPPLPELPQDQLYFNSVNRALILILQKYVFLDTEMIVFSRRLGLAGIIDILVLDLNGEQKQVVMWDWKSSKAIKENGFGYALPPIQHLPNTDWVKHQLQLNLYERILKEEEYVKDGVRVRKGVIHVLPNHLGWHKVVDRQLAVTEMLNHGNKLAEHSEGTWI